MKSVDVLVSDMTEQVIRNAELPAEEKVYRFIDALCRELALPARGPDGLPIKYQILHKETHTQILDLETLSQKGVNNGDTLMLIPEITAGATWT